MDLENLIKRGTRYKDDHHGRKYDQHEHHQHHDHNIYYPDGRYRKAQFSRHHKMQTMLRTFKSHPHKKALLVGAALLSFLALATCILLLFALIPIVKKGMEYIDINGIKGILDGVLPYIDKIWKGNS